MSKAHFDDAAGAAKGQPSGVDHAAEALKIIGNDNLTHTQKAKQISSHPTLPQHIKDSALDFIVKQSGGGVAKPAAEPSTFREKPRPKIANTDQMSVSEEPSVLTESELAARGGREVGAGAAPRRTPTPSTRGPKPTNRTRGTRVPQTMNPTDLHSHLTGVHSQLKTAVDTLRSFKNLPENVAAVADYASEKLGKAGTHLAAVPGLLRGRKEYDEASGKTKFYSGEKVANEDHLMPAATHLKDVHDILDSDIVHDAAKSNNTSLALPTDELKAMVGHSKNLQVVKRGRSIAEGKRKRGIDIAGTKFHPDDERLDTTELAKKGFTKENPGIAKIDAFKRKPKRVGKTAARFNGTAIPQGYEKGALEDPRRKAGQSSSPSRYRGADTSAGQTPKFDATSAVEGGDAGMRAPKKKGK